ncbi:hypothetical protein G3I18_07650, partial [Actinospica acidiphila]|nr:hypothetical protein [Actinospica acidiphila]
VRSCAADGPSSSAAGGWPSFVTDGSVPREPEEPSGAEGSASVGADGIALFVPDGIAAFPADDTTAFAADASRSFSSAAFTVVVRVRADAPFAAGAV